MSPLYVYALLGETPRRSPGPGLAGEPVRVLPFRGFFVAAGEMGEAPALDPASLRGHDGVIRRLVEVVAAVLPAQYGAFFSDEEALAYALGPQAAALEDALAMVHGREQMTLRVYGDPTPAPVPVAEEEGRIQGPGARYLAMKMRGHARQHALPEIEPLRRALGPLSCAERIERHDAPPLLASVYHLVGRGQGAAYVAAVEGAAPGLPCIRVTISGPWAPYAFAPEGLE